MRPYEGIIATWMGERFRPLEPDPDLIFINDIAHALGNKCRFTGHCDEFYSVAQHCWVVYQIVVLWGGTLDEQKWALLHDAAEAYLPDVATTIKPFLPDLVKAENQLIEAIAERFGLNRSIPGTVEKADAEALDGEARLFMTRSKGWWHHNEDNVVPTIITKAWSPDMAEHRYLSTYAKLFWGVGSDEGRKNQ
jgi:hypothetical protein